MFSPASNTVWLGLFSLSAKLITWFNFGTTKEEIYNIGSDTNYFVKLGDEKVDKSYWEYVKITWDTSTYKIYLYSPTKIYQSDTLTSLPKIEIVEE